MNSTPDLELRTLLGAMRRRWMTVAAFDAAARATVIAALLMAAAAGIDRVLEPAGALLVVFWAVAGLACLGIAALAGVRMARMPTDQQVARFVEERRPELNDVVATATQVDGASGVFGPLLVAAAVRHLRDVRPSHVIGARVVRRAASRTVVAGFVLALAAGWAWAPARRAWASARAYLFPYELALEVTPGDAKVVSGQPVVVKATFKGSPELLARASASLQFLDGSSSWQVAPMVRTDHRFSYEFAAVTRDLRYRVAVGGLRSREYAVRALKAPAVARIDVHYVYPAFTKLEPRLEEDGGDIYAPAGTKVRLRVSATKPAEGALVMGTGDRIALAPQKDNVLDGEFTVTEDGVYRVALLDRDGIASRGENEYFIRVVDDRPPNVQILRPEGDRHVTPLEEVAVEARADDDYGVDRFELVYAVRGGPEKVVALAGNRGTSATGATTLFLEDMKVNPGDFVAYYARARDVGRGKKSVEAQSDIYFLEVKPFEEEFSLAQSQAGAGGEQNRSLAELAKAQKDIVIATWKYNRRAIAGKSAEDIRALGRAQAELKTRATQFSRGVAVRGSGSADGDPIGRAVVAMGRAQSSLEAIKPADALPHEMEALNELLKAMADDRRTQVAQVNQNGGGGGGQQAREDLSALFDKELRRQQQTNYETRQGATQDEQQQREEDPLARLRELARRQDDLARRQKELAQQMARLTEEQRKRELERLTREQSELRQQVEELTRQMGRQQNAQSPSGSQSRSGQSASDQMREISEEMQNAASDLRRSDPSGASARSEQALRRMRDMEQRMRGGQPDERRRILGEMQLEAQQLADAQRRVASEAERTASQGTADSRRRLAGEKERLAERVDKLERNLREMSEAGGADRQQLTDAARELQRGQVSQRMRESAEMWRKSAESSQAASKRDATAQGSTPRPATESDATRRAQVQTERQLADTLRRTAERIGAPGTPQDAATRKLAEDLQRTREVRDRLGDLERRMEQMSKAGQPGDQQPTGQTASDPRAELSREMEAARQMLQRLGRQDPSLGPQHLTTPEHHEFSTSAPGTEAFKQDFTKWESLRRNLENALERVETALSSKLHEQQTRDRLRAGATERLPEEYRKLVDRYYQSLAKGQKP